VPDSDRGEWIRALPKAEVHVHLEGCFDTSDLVELAAAGGEPLPRPAEHLLDLSGLGLSAFLEFLDWSCGLVRTPEQVARAAYQFSAREAESGVRYADVIVNLTHWPAWRGRLDAFIDALDAGFHQAEQDGLPAVGVCLSLLRQQSAAEALELVDWILERRHPRIVALSIDGNEAVAGRTGPRFAEAFRRAAAEGVHRTVHAGESSGPEGVWDAIDLLRAERVDHGVRASEDPALVAELARRRIPLDVCPGTNLHLGLYKTRGEHPLEQLRRAGVRVSVNTDDPAFQRTSVVHEYAEAQRAYAWPDSVLVDIARTSIEASFCDADLRCQLLDELDAIALPG
jgi:adenosine deaminase